MGASGPLPTPKRILRLRGVKRGGGPERAKVPPARPSKPAFLRGEAAAEWRRCIEALEAAGVLAKCDRALLACWCSCWAEWLDAAERFGRDGVTVTGPHGLAVPSPWLAIRDRAAAQLAKLAPQFGFSVAGRARAGVETAAAAEAPDPFEIFLRNKCNGED